MPLTSCVLLLYKYPLIVVSRYGWGLIKNGLDCGRTGDLRADFPKRLFRACLVPPRAPLARLAFVPPAPLPAYRVLPAAHPGSHQKPPAAGGMGPGRPRSGGGDGKAFLVQSFGLTQPRAGRGVVYHESTLTIHHKRSKVHRRLGRMYVRPTTSYTSETSAAFQYDEKEVRLVPKKSNCELRPILWPVFLRVRKQFSYHKRKKELLATE